MPGAGYNIPVSISDATSIATPINQSAGTYFLFASPNVDIGATSQQANPILPATATSSASNGGNARSDTAGSGVNIPTPTSLTGKILIGLSIAGTVFTIYVYLKSRKG